MQKHDQIKMEGILANFPFFQCADLLNNLVNDVINFDNILLSTANAKCPPNQTQRA